MKKRITPTEMSVLTALQDCLLRLFLIRDDASGHFDRRLPFEEYAILF